MKGKKLLTHNKGKGKLQKNEKNCQPILKEKVGERKKNIVHPFQKKKEIKGEKIVCSLQIMIFFYEVCDLAKKKMFNLDLENCSFFWKFYQIFETIKLK